MLKRVKVWSVKLQHESLICRLWFLQKFYCPGNFSLITSWDKHVFFYIISDKNLCSKQTLNLHLGSGCSWETVWFSAEDYRAVSTNSGHSAAYFWFPAPRLKINIWGGRRPTVTNAPLNSAPWEKLSRSERICTVREGTVDMCDVKWPGGGRGGRGGPTQGERRKLCRWRSKLLCSHPPHCSSCYSSPRQHRQNQENVQRLMRRIGFKLRPQSFIMFYYRRKTRPKHRTLEREITERTQDFTDTYLSRHNRKFH